MVRVRRAAKKGGVRIEKGVRKKGVHAARALPLNTPLHIRIVKTTDKIGNA